MNQKYYDVNGAGHSIRCKLYYNDLHSIRHLVLYGHGFAGHKDNSSAQHFAERMLSKQKNSALLCFDWPCHGSDVKKTLRLSDCDAYLGLVLQHVQDAYGISRPDAYATSFGGYLFLRYISDHGSPFRKAVFRSPAIRMYRVLTGTIIRADNMEKIQKGKEVPVGFDRTVLVGPAFLQDLEQADISARDYLPYADNLFIIHGTADEVAPFEHARAFAEENVIDFLPVDGADHRFRNPKHTEQATKAIMEYYFG